MDLLAQWGHVFLGSRLKRLADRFLTDAAAIRAAHGFDIEQSQLVLLAAVDATAPLGVSDAVARLGISQPAVTRSMTALAGHGLIDVVPVPGDGRARAMTLTPAGAALIARARAEIWPAVEAAVRDLCAPLSGSLLEQLAGLEAGLAESGLAQRVAAHRLVLREFDDDLARDFHDINAEWIEAMFELEPVDRRVLQSPRREILEPGGAILFVEAAGLGIVGTCALRRSDDASFELTKMGVRAAARGLGAGGVLLDAMIARGRALGARDLWLLTNRRCAAAIRLYERAGFVHDADTLRRHGGEYVRCDVAMRLALG